MICEICKNEFKNRNCLIKHLRKYHNIEWKQYYDIYLKKENEGICLLCKTNTTTFYNDGYKLFCSKCKGPKNQDDYKKAYGDNWEEKWNEMKQNKKDNCCLNIQYYINKGFSEDEAKEELRKKQSRGLQYYIDKHGEEEGKIKHQEFIDKSKNTLEHFIQLYGKEEGLNRYNSWVEKCTWSKENFIKHYGDEAEQKMKERKQKQIDSFNARPEAEKIEMKSKWCHTEQGYINRYGEEKGLELWTKRIENFKKLTENAYSKSSQKLFWAIYNFLGINKQQNVYFKELNDEYYIPRSNHLYFVDFKLNNKIIEFYGDAWHMNPNKFQAEDICISKKCAQEIWDYDKERENYIKSKGYEILIIWESEYKKNKSQVIEKCLNFLNK